MQIIKGFVTIGHLILNTPDQTALIGELSTWSRSYNREKGTYQDLLLPSYNLVAFKSTDTTTDTTTPVSQDQASQILEVVKACEDYAGNHIRPYDKIDYVNVLTVVFNNRISNIVIGDMVDNGTIEMPEWISWTSDEYDNNEIRIWLADRAFAAQYDEYEILVVSPLLNLDSFYDFYNIAVASLTNTNVEELLQRIEVVKDNDPETYLRVMEFDYYNKDNLQQSTPTNWGVVIYGKAGDNIDIIKDTLVDYILTNSTHTAAEWTVIFPDIFKRTEFIVLPRWDKISIPNLTTISALYGSMLDPKEAHQFCLDNIPFYDQFWIEDNVTLMPFDFKALMLSVVNGQENVTGSQDITTLFSDYIPVSTSTLDFSRMSVNTRDWVLLLEKLLIAAEDADIYTALPEPLRKVVRDGDLYITAVYNNINYLVAARSNSVYNP